MARTFSTMKTNVAEEFNVENEAAMLTRIGKDINDGYIDLSTSTTFSALIDDNYTFESVVDQAEYDLPTGAITSGVSAIFDRELMVVNVATGKELKLLTEAEWWKKYGTRYQDDTLTSGTSQDYVILRETKKIKLSPPPDTAETYAMPYKKTAGDLTDNDYPVMTGSELALEMYGRARLSARLKQVQKAEWYMGQYEYEKGKMILREKNTINKVFQRISAMYRGGGRGRKLTGDRSYESI